MGKITEEIVTIILKYGKYLVTFFVGVIICLIVQNKNIPGIDEPMIIGGNEWMFGSRKIYNKKVTLSLNSAYVSKNGLNYFECIKVAKKTFKNLHYGGIRVSSQSAWAYSEDTTALIRCTNENANIVFIAIYTKKPTESVLKVDEILAEFKKQKKSFPHKTYDQPNFAWSIQHDTNKTTEECQKEALEYLKEKSFLNIDADGNNDQNDSYVLGEIRNGLVWTHCFTNEQVDVYVNYDVDND